MLNYYDTWLLSAEKLKFFVSYSHEDKHIAGMLKGYLERFGTEVFVAHDDIKPSAEWVTVILKNLDESHVFIPIITDNFPLSKWTDQETGIAFGASKYIIPLKMGINPYGFIAEIQARDIKAANDSEILILAYEIIDILFDVARKEYDTYEVNFRKLLFNSLVIKFINSESFAETYDNMSLITRYQNRFSTTHINLLLVGSMNNRQIYESFKAWPFITDLFKRNKGNLDEDVEKEFSEFLKVH